MNPSRDAVPLLAGHLAGLAADADRGVGEEPHAWLGRPPAGIRGHMRLRPVQLVAHGRYQSRASAVTALVARRVPSPSLVAFGTHATPGSWRHGKPRGERHPRGGHVAREAVQMPSQRTCLQWPVLRPASPGPDRLGRGAAVASPHQRLRCRGPAPRTGRRQRLPVLRGRLRAAGVTSRTSKVIQIEGDPDSPVSRGRLCPKGSASLQLDDRPGPRDQVQLPAAARHRVGGPRPRHGDGHDRRPGDRDPRATTGRRRPTASASAAPWASPASAGRPSTTRRTTS